jgi:threonine aldolase
MRFLSAQLLAWFDNDGWRARASHANAQAAKLACALTAIPGIEIVQPVEANLIFTLLSDEVRARLNAAEYFVYELPMFGEGVVRFATSWATTDESIDDLLSVLRG